MQLPARFATSLLLILFGFTFILSATLPTAEIGSWSPGPNMAHVRANASAVVLDDGSLFVSGGDGANGPLASAEIFASGSFSSAGSMSVARSHHASVQLQDGRVLVTGGITTGGGASNQAEIFDPADGSWSPAGDLQDARSGHTSSLLKDRSVLIDGVSVSPRWLSWLDSYR